MSNEIESVYAELAALGANVDRIRSFNPTFRQAKELLDGLKKLQEWKTGACGA
jgi:hypothetical protein